MAFLHKRAVLLKPGIFRFALRVGALYALFGLAWILGSDVLITTISRDAEWLVSAQRYKGSLYVLVTSLGLFWLVKTGCQQIFDAVQQAEASELQVRDLYLEHPQPMWVHDRETLALLSANEAAVQYYGYPREQLLTMNLADLCPAPDRPGLRQLMRDLRQGRHDLGVVRQRKRCGLLAFVHLSGHAVEFSQQQATMVMALDVTADIESKDALGRQEAQFRQLHESLDDVLWTVSPDAQTVLYASPSLHTLYGFGPEALKADPGLWQRAVHPDDAGIAMASHAALLATGESSCTYRIHSASGQTKWVLDRKRLILDAQGQVAMMGGIVKDVTAAQAHEALRAATQLELEGLVAQRTAELVRVNTELDAFARTVAHDLKAPLLSVVGFTRILQRRYAAVLKEDGARLTGRIEQVAQQMASLVAVLLDLSRVSTAPLKIEPVDLVPLARELVDELREREPGRQVLFEAPDGLQVQADARLLRPLLTNLLGNAWKFTGRRDDARISLCLLQQDGEAVVCIQDNGAGFDQASAQGLFQPFQRFHTLSEFSGSGIGLTTCARIVARHQGRIWLESAPGQGTSAFFTLAPAGLQSAQS